MVDSTRLEIKVEGDDLRGAAGDSKGLGEQLRKLQEQMEKAGVSSSTFGSKIRGAAVGITTLIGVGLPLLSFYVGWRNEIQKGIEAAGKHSAVMGKMSHATGALKNRINSATEASILNSKALRDHSFRAIVNTERLSAMEDQLNDLAGKMGLQKRDLAESAESIDAYAEEVAYGTKATGKMSEGVAKASATMKTATGTAVDLGDKITKVKLATIAFTAVAASIGGLIALGTSIHLLTKRFTEFDKRLREVSTILPEGSLRIEKYDNRIKDLATTYGTDLNQNVKAFYDTVSAGFNTLGQASLVVEQANKLAIAGVTDVSKATDILTSALNAYQLTAGDSEKISDILFSTVEAGKTTIEEMSNALGRVAPTANTANVPLEAVAASLATMTSQGIKTDQAVTRLDALLFSLASRGYETQLANEGLAATLATVQEQSGGTLEGLQRLLGSKESAAAAAALYVQEGHVLNANLKKTEDASGATQRAFDKFNDSLSQSKAILGQEYNLLVVELGEVMEDSAVRGANALAKMIGVFNKLLEILNENNVTEEHKQHIRDNVEALEELLRKYNLQIEVFQALLKAGMSWNEALEALEEKYGALAKEANDLKGDFGLLEDEIVANFNAVKQLTQAQELYGETQQEHIQRTGEEAEWIRRLHEEQDALNESYRQQRVAAEATAAETALYMQGAQDLTEQMYLASYGVGALTDAERELAAAAKEANEAVKEQKEKAALASNAKQLLANMASGAMTAEEALKAAAFDANEEMVRQAEELGLTREQMEQLGIKFDEGTGKIVTQGSEIQNLTNEWNNLIQTFGLADTKLGKLFGQFQVLGQAMRSLQVITGSGGGISVPGFGGGMFGGGGGPTQYMGMAGGGGMGFPGLFSMANVPGSSSFVGPMMPGAGGFMSQAGNIGGQIWNGMGGGMFSGGLFGMGGGGAGAFFGGAGSGMFQAGGSMAGLGGAIGAAGPYVMAAMMAYQLAKSLDSGGTPTTAQGIRLDRNVGTGKAVKLAGGQTIGYEQINQGDSSEMAAALLKVAQKAFDDAVATGMSEANAVELIRQAISKSSTGIEGHGVGDFLGLSHEDGRVGRTAQDALSGFGKALESVFAPQVKLLEEEARAEQERLNSFDHLFEQGKLQLTGLDDIIANLDTGSPLYEMLVSNRDSLVSTLERMVAEEVVKGNLEAAKGNELIESLKMVAEEQVEEIKKNKEVNMMVVESMNKWWAASEARRAAEEEKKFADAAAEAGSSASLAGAFRTAGHSDFNPYEGRFDSLSEEQVLAQIAHYENLRKRNIAENNTLEGGGIALHGEAALSHRGFGHALTELKEVLMEIRDDTRISASATSQTAVNTGSV